LYGIILTLLDERQSNISSIPLGQFTARIIAVDTSTKIVRFSINHHILALNGEYAAFPHSVGTVIKNAQVIRVDAGIGALLALPSSDDTEEPYLEERRKLDKELSNNLLSNSDYRDASKVTTAYVHISKSMDNPDADDKKGKQKKSNSNNNRTPDALFARHFSINTRVKALRILSTSNLIDGIASCATAKSIVDAHVLTHADIVPGKIYKDVPVVQLLDSGGVLVDLGIGTKGIIPATHLFDKASHGSLDVGGDLMISGYRQKIRQQKYKVGNKITVRCLTVDPVARQCVLTAKKTLLANDIDDPIVDYPVDQDRVAAGFLSKVDDTGLTVTFYNNVHGRVTSRSLAAELGVEDPRQNYNVGDAIAARVVSCERRRNRSTYDGDDLYYYQLKLSLKTVVDKVDNSASMPQVSDGSAVPFAAGSIVMPKRMKVLQIVSCHSRDDGTFLPGYAVLSVKSKFFTGLPTSAGDSIECKLPFDQLLDSYELSNPPIELEEIGQKMLTVGKRIEAEVVILTIPNGVDSLPVVGLRPTLIKTVKMASSDDSPVICPSLKSNLFIGKYVCGYVTRIDERFGAFVRFFDGLTGLIPKLKKGLNENLFDTIFCKVTALDITSSPPKILLKKVTESEASKPKKRTSSKSNSVDQIQVGDVVGDVKVVDINFARAKVYIVGNDSSKLRARIHVTMANPLETTAKLSKKEKQFKEEHKIGKSHPFYNWKVGDVIPGVRCVSTDTRDGIAYVELANRVESGLPAVVTEPSHLPPGSILSAIVTSVSKSSSNHGLWVQVCPGVSGFIPALEVSEDPDVLNDLATKFKVGSRITCCVMEQTGHNKLPISHNLQKDDHDSTKDDHKALFLSVLLVPGEDSDNKESGFKPTKPQRADIVVGRINKKSVMQGPPSLMMSLRGGFIGRCCITELTDENEWTNKPVGRVVDVKSKPQERNTKQQVVSDSDADHENDDDNSSDSDDENDR
jgi:predicted RNA-binding protein with RPS1 domain